MFKFGEQLKKVKGNQTLAQLHTSGRRNVTASSFGAMGAGSGFGLSGGLGGRASGGGQYRTSRFNPVHDHLEIGSIIEDWMPRDAVGLNQMFRLIYLRDAIVGPTIDLYSNLPYSDCRLAGIEDPEILKIFQSTMENLDMVTMMPELVREFLMVGKFALSLIFDARKGIFTGMVPHDPDFLRIQPIPIQGSDPKLDLIASPALKEFLSSTDERDIAERGRLPKSYFDTFEKSGTIKLDPLTTVFVPRRANPYDMVGTSFLTRVISFWALEKSLIESTVTNARRRTRAILHLKLGLDNLWEPSAEEMDAIAGLFIQADEDPVGSVVATRTGVETNEVKGGVEFWKLSDEWAFLTEGKMRALGVSDSFLSGEASYNNGETALSVFMETLRTLRAYMDRRVFYEKIFATLARVHGFIKNEEARGPAMRRYNLSYKKALAIPKNQLLMPKVVWNKKLQPEGDMNFMEMLRTADEAGVPITLKQWSSAAGINLEETMEELDEDGRLRKIIAEWRKQFTGQEALQQEVMSSEGLRALPIWDSENKFVTLSSKEAFDALDHFVASKANLMKLITPQQTLSALNSLFDGNEMKVELMAYLLNRLGMSTKLQVPERAVQAIGEHLVKIGKENDSPETRTKIVQEFQALARVTSNSLPKPRIEALTRAMSGRQDMSPFTPRSLIGIGDAAS